MTIRLDAHLPEFHRGAPPQLPVRAATTASITISTALNNGDTLDGLTLATGDRVLVKNQSTGSQNGVYIVGVTPARSFDMSEGVAAWGAVIYVIAGTANGGKTYVNTNATLPTIDSTSLTWVDYSPSAGVSFATPAIVLGTAAAAGAASTVIRSDSTIVAFDATAPTTIAYSDVAATGSAAMAARRDHRHGMVAAPTPTGIGEILISDTPSTPLVFADLIQNEAEDDLVYADLGA